MDQGLSSEIPRDSARRNTPNAVDRVIQVVLLDAVGDAGGSGQRRLLLAGGL